MAAETFRVTTLVDIFRAALLDLLPTMDRAKIKWSGPGVYDPWENIESALFRSIVGTCVENATPDPFAPLPPYGMASDHYREISFLTEGRIRQSGKTNALLGLTTKLAPFDTAVFLELDSNYVPTTRRYEQTIGASYFEIAGYARGTVSFMTEIMYSE